MTRDEAINKLNNSGAPGEFMPLLYDGIYWIYRRTGEILDHVTAENKMREICQEVLSIHCLISESRTLYGYNRIYITIKLNPNAPIW